MIINFKSESTSKSVETLIKSHLSIESSTKILKIPFFQPILDPLPLYSPPIPSYEEVVPVINITTRSKPK